MTPDKSTEHFELLAETASQLLSSNNPQQIINDLCLTVMRHLDCDMFFNYLVDEDSKRLQLNAFSGVSQSVAEQFACPNLESALLGNAVCDGCYIGPGSSSETPESISNLVSEHGIRCFVCQALYSAGCVIGAVAFGSRRRGAFEESELALMKTVTDQVAVALQRKRTEEALQKSELFLATILASLRDHVAVIDRGGAIVSVNAAWTRFAEKNGGRRCGVGANYLETCRAAGSDDPQAEHVLAGIQSVLSGTETEFVMEYECSSPAERRWFLMTALPLKGPGGAAVISHADITGVKQAEEKLAASERSLAEAQRLAHLGSWEWDVQTGDLTWSDEVYRIFGLEPQEFGATYEAFLEKVHPVDRSAVVQAVDNALADPAFEYSIEHRVVLTDGSERVVHEYGEVTFSADGRPLRMLGTVLDITDRKRAQLEIEKAFEEIRQLTDRLEAENIYLKQEAKASIGGGFIGESRPIQEVMLKVRRVAPADSVVLISGETGTGKELVAQAIHDMSRRRDRPIIKVNCAALPATLIEGELFGREKGAYTGAVSQQKGRFEIADGSSLFLDEIGELTPDLQVKLLRVLQEGEFERLGSTHTRTVDVRIMAATNRDLEKMVREGAFRSDLYYRLNVFPIHVPPLRERTEDIPLLVWHFVRLFADKMGKIIDSVPRRTMEALQKHAWPGNIRELRNVIEHAVIMSDGRTLAPVHLAVSGEGGALVGTLEEVERAHIIKTLGRTGWRIRGEGGAAKLLGLKPTTLHTRMKKLGIQRPSR